MQTRQLIDSLELLAERHKDDKYYTFETRWIDVLKAVIDKLKELDWHTGTPTEEGWYLLEYNIGNSDETYYVTDHWSNEVGYWTVDRVIRWQKIEPYEANT